MLVAVSLAADGGKNGVDVFSVKLSLQHLVLGNRCYGFPLNGTACSRLLSLTYEDLAAGAHSLFALLV